LYLFSSKSQAMVNTHTILEQYMDKRITNRFVMCVQSTNISSGNRASIFRMCRDVILNTPEYPLAVSSTVTTLPSAVTNSASAAAQESSSFASPASSALYFCTILSTSPNDVLSALEQVFVDPSALASVLYRLADLHSGRFAGDPTNSRVRAEVLRPHRVVVLVDTMLDL